MFDRKPERFYDPDPGIHAYNDRDGNLVTHKDGHQDPNLHWHYNFDGHAESHSHEYRDPDHDHPKTSAT